MSLAGKPKRQESERLLAEFLQMPLLNSLLLKLEGQLPRELVYHSVRHTRDVLAEVVFFAVLDELSAREIELLAVAAVFHDAGFLEGQKEHELRGAQMAAEAMTAAGSYAPEEIHSVQVSIRDTKLVNDEDGVGQRATSKLSNYLCDADMSNLGREDFFEKLDLVRQEMGAAREQFLGNALLLIMGHHWHTEAARSCREQKKLSNIIKLKELVGV